jgi:hypothetical protein
MSSMQLNVMQIDGDGNVPIVLGDDTVNTADVVDDAITTAKIDDGTILDADVDAAADIAVSKLAPGTNGQVLTTTGGATAWGAGGVVTGTEIEGTDEGATGALLDFYHNSGTPAINDSIGGFNFYGNDDAAAKNLFATMGIGALGVGAGAEEGVFVVSLATAGAVATNDAAQFTVFEGGFNLKATNDTAVGQVVSLIHESASPASDDIIGAITATGNDDAASSTDYAQIEFAIDDPAAGAESGAIILSTVTGGAMTEAMGIGGGYVNVSVPLLLDQTEQTLSGAGAVDITSQATNWDCSGAVAGTLADSNEPGQLKEVYCGTYVGNGTLTPTSLLGFTTITFTAVGQSVLLRWNGSAWVIRANHGATIA